MRLKKVMATGLVAALALSTMVGCSSKKDSSDQKKIGVVQLVEHDALDASYKGFKDGLEKAGYKDGDKIKIEYKNAQNEQSNCQTIAKQFVTPTVSGCSSMVELQPSKLITWVRFPSPAF